MLLGATGLVGRECLRLLLADPGVTRIVALTRRPLDDQALWPKLRVEIVDFEQLASRGELFGVDQIFCALGTTIKKAGSRDAFRAAEQRVEDVRTRALALAERVTGQSAKDVNYIDRKSVV